MINCPIQLLKSMTKKKPKKPKKEDKPKVNKELEGFDIEIDAFGEIKTNFRH